MASFRRTERLLKSAYSDRKYAGTDKVVRAGGDLYHVRHAGGDKFARRIEPDNSALLDSIFGKIIGAVGTVLVLGFFAIIASFLLDQFNALWLIPWVIGGAVALGVAIWLLAKIKSKRAGKWLLRLLWLPVAFIAGVQIGALAFWGVLILGGIAVWT